MIDELVGLTVSELNFSMPDPPMENGGEEEETTTEDDDDSSSG